MVPGESPRHIRRLKHECVKGALVCTPTVVCQLAVRMLADTYTLYRRGIGTTIHWWIYSLLAFYV